MWDSVPPDWHIIGTGDFNGDGIDDILWRNDNGAISDWLGTGDGSFTINDSNAFTQVGTDWYVPGVGDFNGDGRDDIVWSSDSGALSDWLAIWSGGFVGNDAVAYQQVGTNWQVVATGDFNGDGRDDLLWRSDTGLLSNWLGQANGGFAGNDAIAMQQVGLEWRVVGTGDFNGDGRDDILWRSDTGMVGDWLGLANGGFSGNDAVSLQQVSLDWRVVGTGDFNGDGRDDILWRSDGGQLGDWLGLANGGFSGNDTFQQLGADYLIAGTGDFNGDGRDDVLLRAGDGSVETWHGSTDGSLLTPPEQLWAQALAKVQEFFDAITSQVSGYSDQSSGSDQNSYYDDASDHSPFEPVFMEMWGFLPSIQSDPAAHYWDFLTQDIDPEFQEFVLNSLAGAGFSGTFGNNFGSMTQETDGTTSFDMNGMLMRGTWHPFETSQEPIPPDAVVITGNNVGYWTFARIGFCGFDPSAGYAPPNNGGGSGATPNATPCVETTFATPNASLADANREALEASNEIAARNDWDAYEYSSIVYISNGVVGHTDVQTQHLAGEVNWLGNLNQVPDGAVILGIVHSHPDLSGITDTIPSGGGEGGNDWIMYRTLVNLNSDRDTAHDLPRGITVDPNMLLWIRSPEDPDETYVYDNTDKSQTAPGCSL